MLCMLNSLLEMSANVASYISYPAIKTNFAFELDMKYFILAIKFDSAF